MLPITITTVRPAHRYDIFIASGLFKNWRREVRTRFNPDQVLVLCDANVARLYPAETGAEDGTGWRVLMVEPGETRKTLGQYGELCEKALSSGIDRKTLVVAVGGGVTGDIAGFLAATLLRGLRFVQIPTTLLAQVDSSVGGKTGVNAAAGKNLVGAFHQPEAVFIDPSVLDTLTGREYLAGVAEVVKYGVMADKPFFDTLRRSAEPLRARDHAFLTTVIDRCCRIKAEIVAEDETEKGKRALLNLGHTFGHALEALAGYDGMVLHGEAVAVGTALAAEFAVREGRLAAEESRAIGDCLAALGIPARICQLGQAGPGEPLPWPELLTEERLREALLLDKKADNRRLSLVLPSAVGKCDVVKGIDADKVARFMQECL